MRLKPNSLFQITLSVGVVTFFVGCSFLKNPSTASDSRKLANNSPFDSQSQVTVAENFKLTTVLSDLEHPWSMAWLPDGAILITERPGRLRIVRNSILEPEPIGGIPEVLAVGQGGLMDVTVHPDFAENRWIYLTYAYGSESANHTRIARAKFDGQNLQDLEVIFEVDRLKTGGQHFGSRIVWLPDRTMLVAIGDGGNPPIQLDGELIRQQAQNLNSLLGKVVRLNDDGSIPTDNPLIDSNSSDGNVNTAIWSYGHRNIQGLAFDATNNQLWSSEHGARGGDELNLLTAGQNYGWPLVTYSEEYTGGEISPARSRPGMVDPKIVWTPAIAPSGLAIYQSDRFGEWQGNLFAGGLVSGDVRRIQVNAAGNVTKEESIAIGQRVRDVKQSPDGQLYILTDESNGQLIRLEPQS